MTPEPEIDPRHRPLGPDEEEVNAWAAREHARRKAWIAGPSEEERLAWRRRYRLRATLGLEESRLGPTEEDGDQWAERERRRRAAWLAGPSEFEKHEWARRQQDAPRATPSESPRGPSDEEIEAWAAREKLRREKWVAGPSVEEKEEWARREKGSLLDDLMSFPAMTMDRDLPETAQRLLREAELAAKGAVYALSQGPGALWSYLVRAGKSFEEEFYQQPRRRRVRS